MQQSGVLSYEGANDLTSAVSKPKATLRGLGSLFSRLAILVIVRLCKRSANCSGRDHEAQSTVGLQCGTTRGDSAQQHTTVSSCCGFVRSVIHFEDGSILLKDITGLHSNIANAVSI